MSHKKLLGVFCLNLIIYTTWTKPATSESVNSNNYFNDLCLNKNAFSQMDKETISSLEDAVRYTENPMIKPRINQNSSCTELLQFLPIMEELDIKVSENLSFLRFLPKLKKLTLRENPFVKVNLEAITSLKNLEFFEYIGNERNIYNAGDHRLDIKSLASLENLRKIKISGPIKNPEIIGSLRRVTDLNLSLTGIQDISFIKHFPQLSSLDVSRNGLRDISSLSNIIHLTSLNLGGNKISSIRHL